MIKYFMTTIGLLNCVKRGVRKKIQKRERAEGLKLKQKSIKND